MTTRILALALLVTMVAIVAIGWLGVSAVPVDQQNAFTARLGAAATVVVAINLLLAWAVGEGLARPLRRATRTIEQDPLTSPPALGSGASGPPEATALVLALGRARQSLYTARDQLDRDRAQITGILQHMADGVLVLNADEGVELANPAARRLLGPPAGPGERLVEVVRDATIVEIVRSVRSAAHVTGIVEVRQRRGRRWVQVVAARLPGGSRTLVLLQDVTEFRRVEAVRRDFVANISHDLRTPVAALKALVETLEGGALEEPDLARDFLRRMHVEVDGLARLVTELLELARAESGQLDLELVPNRAGDLVREAVDRLGPYAERRGLQVMAADDGAADVLVLADPRRVGQVLANLFANAVQFTSPGGRIEVGARSDGSMVEFWVADSGIGIHPDNLVRVFERFYRTDPSRTGNGTGLGLAICKHFVQAHGGAIWVESEGEGRGSTFRFTLRAADEPRPNERPNAASLADGVSLAAPTSNAA